MDFNLTEVFIVSLFIMLTQIKMQNEVGTPKRIYHGLSLLSALKPLSILRILVLQMVGTILLYSKTYK